MKVQRVFTLMLLFFVLSTATVVASSIWGDYDGYSIARVYVNDRLEDFSSSDVPALIVNGKTMLPLRSLANSLQSLIKWDNSNKTVSLYKPNVHMLVAQDIGKDYSLKTPFGVVNQGETISFVVFTQVDNLRTSVSSVRVSIESPSGVQVVTPVVKAMNGQKDTFWLPVPFKDVSFDEYGNYVVKFEMKLDESSNYAVVSEKLILSK